MSTGLSHPFLGMGPGPLELGKIASFSLKLGKKYKVLCIEVFIVRLDLTHMVLLYFQRNKSISRQNRL